MQRHRDIGIFIEEAQMHHWRPMPLLRASTCGGGAMLVNKALRAHCPGHLEDINIAARGGKADQP